MRALVLLLLPGLAAAAPARQEELLYANCPMPAGEFVGELGDQLVLARAFLDENRPLDDQIRESVEHQLRYLWGHYRNDAAAHRSLQVVLSAETPEVEIVQKREAPYGRDLVLDWDHPEERLQITDPYTVRAVARGRIGKSDPALIVDYHVRFKLAICGRGEAPPPRVTVPLPRDPWLAYWHVPKSLHRKLRYYADTAVTNPCADDDFADLPHPFYYWYDWLPDRHGPDADGRPFDCRNWLHAGADYFPRQVTLTPLAPATRELSALKEALGDGPMNATILIGVLDHEVTDLSLEAWRERIGTGAKILKERVAAALAAWKAGPPHERGTGMLLRTLAALPEVMTVDAHESSIDDGYLRVEVRGHLQRSGRAVRLKLWLGMTDIFGPRPPRHFRLLRRGLLDDELVFYWGHSGIGENFRLAQIQRNLGLADRTLSEELSRSPTRLIAFISCYSYMYFGQDLLAASAARPGNRFFVFTGMGPVVQDHGPLPLLDLVDQALAPGATRLEKLRFLADDEFWLVKAVIGSRP